MQTWLRIGLFVSLLAWLALVSGQTGRADIEAYQADTQASLIPVEPGDLVEQTFLSTQTDLKSVWMFAAIQPSTHSSAATIRLRLWALDGAGETLVANQTVSLLNAPARLRLELQFQPQANSRQRAYRVDLSSDAPAGAVSLYASRTDRYSDGGLRINGQDRSADLAFELGDALSLANWTGDGAVFWRMFALGLGLAASIFVMGCAILVLTLGKRLLVVPGWPILAAACGLALIPLLYQVCSLLHIALTAVFLAGFFGLLFAVGLAYGVYLLHTARVSVQPKLWRQWASRQGFSLVGFGLFLAAFGLRLAQVRDLSAPSWTDGLVHLDLIERILADQGIPQGVLYHTGYHSLVVFLHTWIAGDLPMEMLLVGQLTSALVGLGFFALALSLLRKRWAALFAASLIWFLSPFPTYLFNWGRYPFLLGLTLLCAALAAGISAWWAWSWRLGGVAGFLLAGMVFCHYGMAGFGLSFAVSSGLLALVVNRHRVGQWVKDLILFKNLILILAVFLLCLAGLLFWRFGSLLHLDKLRELVEQSRQAAQAQDYRELVGIAFRGPGAVFGLLCLYGAGIVWQTERNLLPRLLGWLAAQAGLIAVLSPFLGETVASYTNLIIFLPLPLALFGGAACAWLCIPAQPAQPFAVVKRRSAVRPISFGWGRFFWTSSFLLALVLLGGSSLLGQVNPATVLLTPADRRAAQWLNRQTDARGVWLINSARFNGAVAAVDGGGWLHALTGRKTVFWTQEPPAATQPLNGFTSQWDYAYLGRGSGFLTQAGVAELTIPSQIVYQGAGVVLVRHGLPEP